MTTHLSHRSLSAALLRRVALGICLLSVAALSALDVSAQDVPIRNAAANVDGAQAVGVSTWTVAISARRDNTLYEEPTGGLSNGAGIYLFAGRTNQLPGAALRRAVMVFDVPGFLPSSATVATAELALTMNQTVAGNVPFDLHRLTADWGEGTSDAPMEEGAGAASTTDDATWIHTFFDTATWATVGGDFDPSASATVSVDGNGRYTWGSTPQLVNDVQGWLTIPSDNFGWILVGDESTNPTAKRFASREHPTPADRPLLVITYSSSDAVFLDGFESGNTNNWSNSVP